MLGRRLGLAPSRRAHWADHWKSKTAMLIAAVTVLAACSAGTATGSGPVVRGDVASPTPTTSATQTETRTAATIPGAPGITDAVATEQTVAVVRFTAPASNGGSTITQYTATSTPGGQTGTLSQAGSGTIMISGLTPNTAYTFTVTATNAIGTSAMSAASAMVTTLGPPGMPGIGAVAATGQTSATVAFTAPASNGGSTITSYTATSNPGGKTGTLSQAGSGTITVTELTPGTAYTFTVTATNFFGTSVASVASASVNTATTTTPGKPGIEAVAATGQTTATVTFTAPASNGGSTITRYTATSSPGGITGTVSRAGSGTITVSGLTSGTAYTFTVTATNSFGTSAASDPSTAVTPFTAPGRPGIGVATATGKTTATVTFTAPASNGGTPITKYTATSSPGGKTGTVTQAGSGTITVTGLTGGTSYTFTITATNAVGTSVASATSTAVTTVPYVVGDTGPGGGKVFYVSTAGFASASPACPNGLCHYLEARTADVATNTTWCNVSNALVSGSFATAIGTGYANTQLMVKGCNSGAGVQAVRSYGGFTDWYLPSNDELNTLLGQASRAGLSFEVSYFWSSSQRSATQASARATTSTSTLPWDKGTLENVRQVRAF